MIARAGLTLSAGADRLAELHGRRRGWVGLALLGVQAQERQARADIEPAPTPGPAILRREWTRFLSAAALVLAGLLMRPQGRLLRVLGWVSVGLVSGALLDGLLLALVGER